jgi:hypothetical protein
VITNTAVFKQVYKTLLEMPDGAFFSMSFPECPGKWHCPIVEKLDDQSLIELSKQVDRTFARIVGNAALDSFGVHDGMMMIDADPMGAKEYDTVLRLGCIRSLITSVCKERYEGQEADPESELKMVSAPELSRVN